MKEKYNKGYCEVIDINGIDDYKEMIDILLSENSESARDKIVGVTLNEGVIEKLRNETEFGIVYCILSVYQSEKEKEIFPTVLDIVANISDIIFLYQQLKFFLWEIEFGNDEYACEQLKLFVKNCCVSSELLYSMVRFASFDKEKMTTFIENMG